MDLVLIVHDLQVVAEVDLQSAEFALVQFGQFSWILNLDIWIKDCRVFVEL